MEVNGAEVRVGILGAGKVAEQYHVPVLRGIPGVCIAWVCDKVEDRARRLAASITGAKAVPRLEDCPDAELVLVTIPVGSRRRALETAFARGWNVLCEKPFALSLADHDAFLALAEAGGSRVGVGLMRRFYRTGRTLRGIIRSGILGEVLAVWAGEGSRLRGTGRDDGWYLPDRSASGGFLFETGSHLVDQVFTALDATDFRIESCDRTVRRGIDFESRIAAVATTGRGREVPLRVEISYLRDFQSGIAVRFGSGILRMGIGPGDGVDLWSIEGSRVGSIDADGGARHVYQAFDQEWRDFLRHCASGEASEVDAASARLSTGFLEQCSALGGAPILEVSNREEGSR